MKKFVHKNSETHFQKEETRQNAETRFQNAKTALSRIFFARSWMDSAQKKAWQSWEAVPRLKMVTRKMSIICPFLFYRSKGMLLAHRRREKNISFAPNM